MNRRFFGLKRFTLFDGIVYFIMAVLTLVFIYPFLYTLSVSLSEAHQILSGNVILFPKGLSFAAYRVVFRNPSMIQAMVFTFELTVLGVVTSIAMTTVAAYPLSRKKLKGKGLLLALIIFTMYFNGGIIPNYILIKNLGLLNRIGALFLPTAISTFYLLIMMNYFRNLPDELEECAIVEGAGKIQIFLKIAVPLSKPVIAALTVFYAVQYWNTFYRALLYISDSTKYTLQLKLYHILKIVDVGQFNRSTIEINVSEVIPENVKAASVIFSAAPIIFVYPWLQKYFVKGITIGALKG